VPVLARLALVVAALTLAACGSQKPSDAVRSSVQRFGKAVADRNYQELCDNLLAGNLIIALEDHGVPCELALKAGLGTARAPTLEIRTITVNGDKALAAVHSTAANQPPSDDTLSLVHEHGKWKISALARPEPQPPTPKQP
jgi:hypothetical protein